MKLIPNSIARKVAAQSFLAKQNSPRILFVGGVVGMVGSTVLACRATLKLEEVLDDVEQQKRQAQSVKGHVDSPNYNGEATYSDNELRKDLTIINLRGVGTIAKLYAPSILLGAASIAALTKSHNLLQDRNLAITAAYATLDGAFRKYRERVVERYGEEADREMVYESETVDLIDEETGKIVTINRAIDAPGSAYARFFDQFSSRNFSQDPDVNLVFLHSVQNQVNDRLMTRGHVFLNEVYDALGLEHTKAGAVTGWRWNKDSGDNYIDFGIWNDRSEVINDFFNGREGSLLLDFNVDGMIYDKLEERA